MTLGLRLEKKAWKLVKYQVAHFSVYVVDLVDLQNCLILSYPRYNLNEVILTFAT